MANIQKRVAADGTVSFRVRVRLKGYPLQTETFERKTDAARWAQKVESAIRDGRHFKEHEAKKHTLGDLIDRYIEDVLPRKPKSARDQKRELLWWKAQIGANALADVTPALIVECRDKLGKGMTPRGTLRTPATVNRYLAALSHTFTIAIKDWQWMEDNPMRKLTHLREPRGRVRYLSEPEREQLLEICKTSGNPALYPVVIVGLSTGMRKSEIMELTWKDVDLEEARLILHDTKNDERRSVPLARRAVQVLRAHRKGQHGNAKLLFPSSRKPKQGVDLTKAWRTAKQRCELEDFHFHDLRHSTASYLAMSGASLTDIAEVLGHKTLAMVKRYAHLSPAHTAAIVERMSAKFLGEETELDPE